VTQTRDTFQRARQNIFKPLYEIVRQNNYIKIRNILKQQGQTKIFKKNHPPLQYILVSKV